MVNEKMVDIFIKADEKIKASFQQLPLASNEEKSLGLVQIQQTSYFLEKINNDFFSKMTYSITKILKEHRSNYWQLYKVKECQVSANGVEFFFYDEKHVAPLVKIETILDMMKISKEHYAGKYVQIGFLLRPENYLDLCLIAYFQEIENE